MLYIIDLKGNLHNKIPSEVIKDLNIVFVSSIEYLLELNCTSQNDYIYFNIESDLKLNKRMIPKGIVLGNLKNVNFKEIIDLEGDKLGLSKLYIFMKKNFLPGSIIGEFKDIKHNCLIKLSIDSVNNIEKQQEQVLKVKSDNKPVKVEQELDSKRENIEKPKKQKYTKEEREAYRKKKAEEFEKRKKERELKSKTPIIPDVSSELKIQDADSSLIKTEKKEDESVQIKEDLNIKEKLPSFLEKTKSHKVHTEVEEVEKKSKVEDAFEVEDIVEDTNPSKIVEGLTVEDVKDITVENFDEPKSDIPTFEIEDIENNSNNSFEIEDVNENPIIKKMLN